ncbi:hypothetical protein PAE9249_00598 [Paenibacillus sp. CECT 9249]|uniref:sodium-dependent transporter n=1 Tax=Paenibacillus sp. CECT 9249 TaxID=2845385 RepID=UPI001E5E8370|nr:sodium-dependent transporter [Paenibacillus sp. CECT 9249]CAH0118132.1 hypothetical protein PAE9249_00598 [Paenibacillus sp. CECT 9249]
MATDSTNQARKKQAQGADTFSSFGFIMAAIGSAVGLGNMWKFPYITGMYGGGAFLVLFIVCLLLIGLPILLAEMALGRAGRGDAVTSYHALAKKGQKIWGVFGLLSVIASFLILCYYSVVTGWTMHYAVASLTGNLFRGGQQYAEHFASFTAGTSPLLYQLLAVAGTGWVIARGVTSGIEKFNKIMIPSLGIILLLLMLRALWLPNAGAGASFFLQPDFSKLSVISALVALGQAFYSLSLGMGAMVTYGSYVDAKQSLGRAAIAVGAGNIVYALIAGLIIFPTTYAFGLQAAQGPGLVFIVLPSAFSGMPFGYLFGGLFFILLATAAFTSLVSLLEVPVAFTIKHWGWSRKTSVLVLCVTIYAISVPTSLSVGGALSNWMLAGKPLFDFLDFFASNLLLPIAGLAVTLFIGYAARKGAEEPRLGPGTFRLWMFLLRYIVPVFVTLIFLYSMGVFG